ncbi:MAG: hypothetical protein QNJ40_09310 [Xanthomonadales bacterium]|nr:hypothetical protein [Xanthomonadales bacterium]
MSSNDHSQLSKQLKTLPELAPGRDLLPDIIAETERRRAPSPFRRWLPMGLAAAALLSLGVILMLSTTVDQQRQEIDSWIAYSQELETQLRQVEKPSAIVRGHQALAIGELEDRVAWVDSALAARPAPEQQIMLWQVRAGLLNDLVNVHAANELLPRELKRRPVMTMNQPVPRARLAGYEL